MAPGVATAGDLAFVQMTDAPTVPGDVDGPTWEFANRPLFASWVRPGGDWRDSADVAHGGAHYAVSPDIGGLGDVAIPVRALVARLLARNTGIYIQPTRGLVKLASRSNKTAPGPRLHVVTTTGSFDAPCVVDTWLSSSSTQPLGGQETLEFPAIVKFDLSAVTGGVIRATLTLRVVNTYNLPAAIAVDYLDPPVLDLPPADARQGIAATVARDKALATHPSVLLYDDLVSKDYIKQNFQGIAGAPPTIDANAEIIQWPQFGLSAARVWSVTTNQRLISWHHWAEPRQSPAKSWQREFGNGHTHLFCRYLLEVGTDVKDGMTEQGTKLPGMTGTYDWSTSKAVTLPQPANDGTWEMRLWHSGVAPSHPDVYHLATYYYGVEWPLSKNSGAGQVRFTKGYLRAGRVHCIEQEVKLNTITNGVPNADGIERVWLDGVLVYENTATRIRGYDKVRIQSIPFVNIYHGGMGMPAKPFHYDIGGICVATEYIGPPKLLRAQTANATSKSSVLGQLAASMAAGTWKELVSQDIDSVLAVSGNPGGSQVSIPFCNSMPWNPSTGRIEVVSADHGETGGSRHMAYDDASNRWLLVDRGIGTHGYQHVAVNPHTGDMYQRVDGDIYKYVGGSWTKATTIPENLTQVPAVALSWWSGSFKGVGPQGALMVYSGNFGTINIWDPLSKTWSRLGGMLPGQLGQYHVVSAYSARKNCLVYGGGNVSQGTNPVDKQVYRLNADGTKTRMPDAPYSLGIYHGMNLVSDHATGSFLAFGFGQGWELNPDQAGKWTQLTGTRAPPKGLLDPTVQPNSLISVDCSTHGVVIYVDALRTRAPKCRMWVYKNAST